MRGGALSAKCESIPTPLIASMSQVEETPPNESPENDVKAPNLFERAKEEVGSTVHTGKSHHKETHGTSDDIDENTPIDDVKAPSVFGRAKEEIESILHAGKSHHKETHGTSDDIDENTPIDDVKGPSVFERAKEEIEAIIEAVLPKKESDHDLSPKR